MAANAGRLLRRYPRAVVSSRREPPPRAILDGGGANRTEDGVFDPLVEEIDEHGVEVDAEDSPRMQAVARAVKAWTDQLIDRSARNNLLFFRDQRSRHARPDEGAAAAGVRHPRRPLPEPRAALSRPTRTRSPTRRAARRTIHNKAQAIYEERGIHTLYLACGLATWDNQHGAAEPAAPVLLAPATLTARGAAQQNFDLQVTGELEVNPTLLNALAAEFDVHCDPEELLAQRRHGRRDRHARGARDRLRVAGRARRARSRASASDPRRCSATSPTPSCRWSATSKASVEALAAHDLIAALAGDAGRPAGRPRPARRRRPDAARPDPAGRRVPGPRRRLEPELRDQQGPRRPGPRHQGPARHRQEPDDQQPHRLPGRARQDACCSSPRSARRSTPSSSASSRSASTTSSSTCTAACRASGRSRSRSPDALHTNATIAQPDLSHEHQRLEARRRELNEWKGALHDEREPVGPVAVRRRGAAARARRGGRDRGSAARADSSTR